MAPFEVVVTHLELTKSDFQPKKSDRAGVAFSRVNPVNPALNRFFYMAIGGQWFWLDRRGWTLAQWTAKVGDPAQVETWILTVDSVPAGFVELDRKDGGRVEIDYLGLLSQYIGEGLGAHLLTSACEQAFAMGATTVLLNTCNLDHPKARANYEARGLKPVRTETKTKELPAVPPGLWEGA